MPLGEIDQYHTAKIGRQSSAGGNASAKRPSRPLASMPRAAVGRPGRSSIASQADATSNASRVQGKTRSAIEAGSSMRRYRAAASRPAVAPNLFRPIHASIAAVTRSAAIWRR